MSWIDWILVGVYLLGLVVLGVKLGKTNKTEKDYFLGGRNFKWWAIGLSIIATQVSAVTFIGAPGWAYTDGLSAIIMTLNIPLVLFFISGIFHPFFYNIQVTSVYEYLEKRFGKVIRALMAFAFLFKSIMVMGTILYAPALVLARVTGISIYLAIGIMAAIGIFYTILGGIKAVIWTDVTQMVVLWFGLVLTIFTVVQSMPGDFTTSIASIRDAGRMTALNFTQGLSVANSVWAGLIGGAVLHLGYFGIDQAQVQRVLTAKSMRHVKHSLWFGGFVVVIQMFFFMMMGSFLYVYFQGIPFENPNDVFIRFALTEFPVGLLGIIIAAIFASAMSSLDSLLNSMTTVVIKDVYKNHMNPGASDEQVLKISKKLTLVFGIFMAVFAVIVSTSNLSILEAISVYGSYLLGSMLGVFILGMLTVKANEKGTAAGFVLGIVAVAFVAQNTEVYWMWNNLIGAGTTIIAGYVISICTGSETKDITLYTIQGQKALFDKRKFSEMEDGVFIAPGRFEKRSYGLLIYLAVILLFFYLIG
ncbi:sodium:solute symporter family transporter [Isachenkonia alkalipeptolytica]|uniref:Sodium/solute symporter n=1 Tax=Isachenkonia alkalipeptolytica TaxID=2565777 RepID=A0AA43XL00_9CLOT|nr:sodium/solute symporter [Isachenkonia alkalipeptolytica]NBG88194.1 sodium/solute symporter [Isachenkonia alkalipeptolytica]